MYNFCIEHRSALKNLVVHNKSLVNSLASLEKSAHRMSRDSLLLLSLTSSVALRKSTACADWLLISYRSPLLVSFPLSQQDRRLRTQGCCCPPPPPPFPCLVQLLLLAKAEACLLILPYSDITTGSIIKISSFWQFRSQNRILGSGLGS